MIDALINLSIFDYLDANTFFTWFFDHASYLYVFCFMVIESSFIPFPSEVVIPPAVVVGMLTGNMNIVLIVLIATLGALLGATINYYISRWLGRPIIYKFANSRFGHAMLIDEEKVKKSEAYFDKHGASATLVGRLIPAVRQLISIPAGLARMNFGKFALFTSLGALIWNSILAALGYWLSTAFQTKEVLFEAVEKYNAYLTIGGIVLLVGFVGYLVYKGLSANRKTRADES